MKRISLTIAFLAAITSSAFAQNRRHYVVGTARPVTGAAHHVLANGIDPTAAERDVYLVESADAFAVDLTADEAERLRHYPGVRYVVDDAPRFATAVAAPASRNIAAQTTPYGIDLVAAPPAWPFVHGESINVAVLDTGIDYTHPDLKDAYAGGYNAITLTDDARDDNGHGTHVAGTIAAADNAIGVVGVAPGVHLWGVKVLDSSGSGLSSRTARGVEWVLQQKALKGGNWIISLSLGGCTNVPAEQTEFAKATAAGILVVAAAGNHDPTQPEACTPDKNNAYSVSYPAAYPGVIAVAGVDANSSVANFSNYGPEVSVAAPGVNVLSTYPVGKGQNTFLGIDDVQIDAAPLTGSAFGSVRGKFVDCGLGKPGEFPDAVRGNIALIKRGDIEFSAKARSAMEAGAIAVVIYNKDDSALSFTLFGSDPRDKTTQWPVVIAVSNLDGGKLLLNPLATLTVANLADDYAIESGTSMATPHVSGAAALVWSAAPLASADAVRNALLSTAHDLGDPGRDTHSGYGLVDAFAAAKALAPARFEPQPITGRRILRRGRG